MGLISTKHYIAINHGNPIIVPLKDMDLVLGRKESFRVRDDEELEIFKHYPNVEFQPRDNYIEVKPFVMKEIKKKVT